jgi:hypothetical protein
MTSVHVDSPSVVDKNADVAVKSTRSENQRYNRRYASVTISKSAQGGKSTFVYILYVTGYR